MKKSSALEKSRKAVHDAAHYLAQYISTALMPGWKKFKKEVSCVMKYYYSDARVQRLRRILAKLTKMGYQPPRYCYP